jgi:ribosomal protein L37AE/L43A
MRNTPAEPSIEQRGTEDLIEDLCLALRDVGVRDYGLPKDERAVSAVLRVQQLHGELSRRGADFTSRLERLSRETSWQMVSLLRDCLMYPEVIPYVREEDGIRRALRCSACRERELPGREGISVWLCDSCLMEATESFRSRVPMRELLLVRAYNESVWCQHADAETVLMAYDGYDGLEGAWCVRCVEEEQARRAGR